MASVFAYNRVQEHRLAARQARHDKAAGGEAAGATDGAHDSDAATVPPADVRVEHRFDMQVEEEPLPDMAHALPSRILDHRLDYIAALSFVAAHPGEEILRRSAEIVRAAKRVEWEGFSESGSTWEALEPAAQYRQVRAGLQLIDRRGVATETELLSFCHGLQALAVTLVAEIDFPSRAEALKAAADFDRQLADLDIQVALNVVKIGGPAMAARSLQQAAEAAGAELQSDGRFCVVDGTGAEAFMVANLEPHPFRDEQLAAMTTRGVTVAMDVPRAPASPEAFQQFVRFARDLAKTMEADLVDDNRRPISPTALAAIEREVVRVRTRLAELGLPAGGALALRVFA